MHIKVIKNPSENNEILEIWKPHNFPSAPLNENDSENALAEACNLFPKIKTVKGFKQIEYGLLHRLDTVTAGLIWICTNQDCYDNLWALQKDNKIEKTYTAVCDLTEYNETFIGENDSFKSFIKEGSTFEITSYFRAFGQGGKEVRPVTLDSNKAALKKLKNPVLYKTFVKIIKVDVKTVQVECKITKGYRHQIRCHLAWIGLPIKNDPIYNERKTEGDIEFECKEIKIIK